MFFCFSVCCLFLKIQFYFYSIFAIVFSVRLPTPVQAVLRLIDSKLKPGNLRQRQSKSAFEYSSKWILFSCEIKQKAIEKKNFGLWSTSPLSINAHVTNIPTKKTCTLCTHSFHIPNILKPNRTKPNDIDHIFVTVPTNHHTYYHTYHAHFFFHSFLVFFIQIRICFMTLDVHSDVDFSIPKSVPGRMVSTKFQSQFQN